MPPQQETDRTSETRGKPYAAKNATKKGVWNWVWIVVLAAISLLWILSPAGLSAKTLTTPGQASVVIDGHPVFEVESSGPYTAIERAQQANRQLALLASLNKAVEVKAVERNQVPTIVAGDQYLLTVTDLDATLDKTPTEQAQDWAKQLEISLTTARQERTSGYLRYAAFLSGLTVLLAAFLHWGVGRFWGRSLKRKIRQALPQVPRTGTPGAQDFHFFMGLNLTLVRLVLWGSAAWYISSLFPNLRQRRYNLFNSSTVGIRAPLFTLGEQPYTLLDLFILLGLVWGLFVLVRLSARIIQAQILARSRLSRGEKEVITQTYRYGMFAVGTLIILQVWGIDLRSVALLGSALGLGIGFGFQDIAKNFGSGLVLLFERSIQVGDFIEIGLHSGVVEQIGARSITLRSLDNISVLVPNAHLFDSQVLNWNHDHPVSRLRLAVGIAYGTDSKIVKSALLQAAQEHSEVLSKPSPDVYIKAFGDSAVEFDLMVWIRDPEMQFQVRSDLYFRIEEVFKEQGISIPYPQRDLHLSSGTLPIVFSPDITSALINALHPTADNPSSKK